MGTVMFVLGAVLNTYTSFLLMTDVNRLEEGTAKTFENMAFKLFGPFTEHVLRYSLVVLLFGFVCGNLVALAPVRHTTPLTTTPERPLRWAGLEPRQALVPRHGKSRLPPRPGRRVSKPNLAVMTATQCSSTRAWAEKGVAVGGAQRVQLLQELALGLGITGFSPTSLLAVVCATVLLPMSSIPDITFLGKWSSPIGVMSLNMLVGIIVYKYATSEVDPVRHPSIELPSAAGLSAPLTLHLGGARVSLSLSAL